MMCCELLSQNKVKTLEDGMKAIVNDDRSYKEILFNNPYKFTLILSKLQAQK